MSKERDAILSKWLNDPKVSGRDGVVKAMEEYSRSQCIAFAKFIGLNNYQECTVPLGWVIIDNEGGVASDPITEDELHDLFIQHQNSQQP